MPGDVAAPRDLEPLHAQSAERFGVGEDVAGNRTAPDGQDRRVVGEEQPIAGLPRGARLDQGFLQQEAGAVGRGAEMDDAQRIHGRQAWNQSSSGRSSSSQIRRRNLTASSPSITR